MPNEHLRHLPEKFPGFANIPWKNHFALLQKFSGYTAPVDFQKFLDQMTDFKIKPGDIFSSALLDNDFYTFLCTHNNGHQNVEFGIWDYVDASGYKTQRKGFRTYYDDELRMIYCEHSGNVATSVGIMTSWVDSDTKESLFRQVALFRDPQEIIDQRSAAFGIGQVERSIMPLGNSSLMHMELIPQFRQCTTIHSSNIGTGTMGLVYARLRDFDANGSTQNACEYKVDPKTGEIIYYQNAGQIDIGMFLQETERVFVPDHSLTDVSPNIW